MPVTGNKSLLSYSLSIRICADGFSFLVYSFGSGQLLLQDNVHCAEGETMEQALDRGLQLPRIAGHHYERVVLYSTSPGTRVPLDEFRREDMLAIYRLTFTGISPKTEDMCFQVIPSLDVVEIFTLQPAVIDTLRSHFPSALVQGLYGTIISRVAEMQQGSVLSVSTHAVVLDGGLMIVVLRKGRLSFANVFRATTNADKLYFLLYVWRTLSLDAWHDSCTLYGAEEEFYNDVRQYLANVNTRELKL